MNEKALRTLVESIVLTELAKTGDMYVPVSSSNRHIHLSQKDLEQLFGADYQLKKLRDLVQPGQYACEERVTLELPKGKLVLRVVGPVRKETQIEISYTEAVKLGVTPMIRMSGDTQGTPGGVLKNGDRQVQIPCGIMVAARHLHMSGPQAGAYGLKDRDVVSLITGGQRETVFRNVIVRAGEGHTLEAHIDLDEANAAALKDGTLCRIEKQTGTANQQKTLMKAPDSPIKDMTVSQTDKKERALITEDDLKAARDAGQTVVVVEEDAIITPLARDAAWEYQIELRCVRKKESK